MALFKRCDVWWYEFVFAGRRIRESSKSTRKTIASEAEKKHRLELEKGFNGIEDKRAQRIRTIQELADVFLEDYKLRHPQSATFASYALQHLCKVLGRRESFYINEEAVKGYQMTRLKAKASPKSINEEVGFLLRLLDEQGDFIRVRLKKQNALKLKQSKQIAKAFTPEDKAAMLAAAKKRRSAAIYPALMLALHAGVRDAELRGLQWERADLARAV